MIAPMTDPDDDDFEGVMSRAGQHAMTPAEREAQRQSWARGQATPGPRQAHLVQDPNLPLALRPPIVLELTRDEVEIGKAIFQKLSVGEDVRRLAGTSAGQRLYMKIVKAAEQARAVEAR